MRTLACLSSHSLSCLGVAVTEVGLFVLLSPPHAGVEGRGSPVNLQPGSQVVTCLLHSLIFLPDLGQIPPALRPW